MVGRTSAGAKNNTPLNGDAHRLLQDFARQTAGQPALRAFVYDDGRHAEVLMELDVGGQRYLVLRSQQWSSSISLSPREQEIARLVAKGLPNKTIGAILDISAWTVATHLRRVFAKLEVNSRSAMVAKLLERP